VRFGPKVARHARSVCWFAALASAVVVMPAGRVTAHTTSPATVRWFVDESAPTIGLIGDSTLSGVRWADRYGELERFNFLFDAESCRRTLEQSCWSREQYRPPNALAALQGHAGEWGEVLVMMTGYNDSGDGFSDGVEAIVDEAGRQGIRSVLWLSLRTKGVDYEDPLHLANGSTYRQANRSLYALAGESEGYLQIADWATFSAEHPEWFEPDGAHLASDGVDPLTEFIASQVDVVLGGGSVTPDPPPWEEVREGDQGTTVVDVQRALAEAGVYDADDTDGVFGPQTAAAIEEFQRRASLRETGAVDEATAAGLGLTPAEFATTSTVAAAGSVPAAAPTPAITADAAVVAGNTPVARDGLGGPDIGAWWLLLLAFVPLPVWLGWRRLRPSEVGGAAFGAGEDPVVRLYDHEHESDPAGETVAPIPFQNDHVGGR
jgi:hypothetical protein